MSLPLLMVEVKQRVILPQHKDSYVTVWRLLRWYGLADAALTVDRRRFEVELPNGLWRSDCMQGPKVFHEGKARKAYLFACIDDMRRFIPPRRNLSSETASFIFGWAPQGTGTLQKTLRGQQAGLPLTAFKACRRLIGYCPYSLDS